MKRIHAWEPWFFVFFGVFHLHRIWAILDRESYASFWLGVMEHRGLSFYLIMGLLALLCLVGIVTFFRERRQNACGAGFTFWVAPMSRLTFRSWRCGGNCCLRCLIRPALGCHMDHVHPVGSLFLLL